MTVPGYESQTNNPSLTLYKLSHCAPRAYLYQWENKFKTVVACFFYFLMQKENNFNHCPADLINTMCILFLAVTTFVIYSSSAYVLR